jgi:hypothetical protein
MFYFFFGDAFGDAGPGASAPVPQAGSIANPGTFGGGVVGGGGGAGVSQLAAAAAVAFARWRT